MYPTNMLAGLLYIPHSKDKFVPEADHVGIVRLALLFAFQRNKQKQSTPKIFYRQ